MEKAGLGLDGESDPQQAAAPQSPGASHRPTLQSCIQALVHVGHCQNADCPLSSCRKIKRIVQHTKGCRKKTNGGCSICKQMVALCCCHAIRCRENRCPVPFCLLIRRALRRRQLQHRLQRLRRRMASMQGAGVGAPQQDPPSPTPPQAAQPPLPGAPPAAAEVARQIQRAAETQHYMTHAQHQTPQVTPRAPMGVNPPPMARGPSGHLEPGMGPTGMQQQPPWAQRGLPQPQQLQSGVLRPAGMPVAQPGQPLTMAPQTGLGQQQQVLRVLHTDPQLLAAFTKPQAAQYLDSNPHHLPGYPGIPRSQSGLQPPAVPGQQGVHSNAAMQLQDIWRGQQRVQQQQGAGPGISLRMADHNQFQRP
ncbi:histone acetyltransferase p300-like isoform 1-T3 [Molossus nigricans]